jgi:hypothetical protein
MTLVSLVVSIKNVIRVEEVTELIVTLVSLSMERSSEAWVSEVYTIDITFFISFEFSPFKGDD